MPAVSSEQHGANNINPDLSGYDEVSMNSEEIFKSLP